jgi:peptidoglycan hydrolase-like protein with peptidoglycan-binding domain
MPMRFVSLVLALMLPICGAALVAEASVRSPLAGPAVIPVAQAAYSSTIYDIQQALNAAGYDAGRPDGLDGRRTREAIQAYQRDQKLLETGEPSAALLEHIRRRVAAAEKPKPERAQPEPAGDPALRALQEDLRFLGYAAEATGQLDVQTHAAIRDYQRDRKLLVTGEYHPVLAEHVRKAADDEEDRRQRLEAGQKRPWGDRHRRPPADRATIAAVQQQLKQRGYPVEAVDGDWNRTTAAAVRFYQQDFGLAETGRPDAELARRLRGSNADDLSRSRVRNAQLALNERRYNAGRPDGALGPSTLRAIADFRRDNGLAPIGALAPAVLAKLGLDAAGEPIRRGREWDRPSGHGHSRGDFEVQVSDRFDDGDYSRDPAWYIASGRFAVRDGALYSSVPSERRNGKPDAGELLGNVLGQALGVRVEKATDAAVAVLSSPFETAFRIRLRLRSHRGGDGLINFGAYSGRDAGSGYRVTIDASNRDRLKLWAVEDGKSRLLGAVERRIWIDDGDWHWLTLERQRDGDLRVVLDRDEVLRVRDRSLRRFSGVSFINRRGDWWVDDVSLATRD